MGQRIVAIDIIKSIALFLLNHILQHASHLSLRIFTGKGTSLPTMTLMTV
jgi:hypothetical protein